MSFTPTSSVTNDGRLIERRLCVNTRAAIFLFFSKRPAKTYLRKYVEEARRSCSIHFRNAWKLKCPRNAGILVDPTRDFWRKARWVDANCSPRTAVLLSSLLIKVDPKSKAGPVYIIQRCAPIYYNAPFGYNEIA